MVLNKNPEGNMTEYKSHLRTVMRGMLAFIPVLFICIYPVLFLYVKNTYDVNLTEAPFIALAQILIGLCVFIACAIPSRKLAFASVYASFFMLLFLNFNILSVFVGKVFPAGNNIIAAIIYALILVSASYFIIKNREAECFSIIQKLLSVMFAFLILLNMVSLIPFKRIVRSIETFQGTNASTNSMLAVSAELEEDTLDEDMPKNQLLNGTYDFAALKGIYSKEKKPNTVTSDERNALEAAGEVLPNFYWIILDEACDFYTMDKYYGYDCNGFDDFLQSHQFNISYNTVNRSAMSNQVMADLCTLDYTATQDMPTAYARYYRYNGKLWSSIQSLGYDIYQVSSNPAYLYSMNELTKVGQRENLFRTATMEGRTQLDLAIDNTPLSLLDLNLMQFTIETRRQQLERVWGFYENPVNYTFDTSIALVTHMMCPHLPFCFAEDGSIVERVGNYNWEEPQYYRGQYIYLMKRMETILENLIENDPGCIIVLMSDHGARPRADDRRVMKFQIEEVDMMRTLNAVYFGGQTMEIEGLDLVNTLRAVLSKMGCDYPQLTETPEILPYPYLH